MDPKNARSGNVLPRKLQELSHQLMREQNAQDILGTLRSMYPNLNTLRGAICKVKTAVLAANVRPPDYDHHMKTWEEAITAYVIEQNATPDSLHRMRDFQHFKNCPLKRQLHIQKKISLGQGQGFFAYAPDMHRAASIQVAPEYVHQLHLDPEEVRAVQEQQAHHMRCLSNTVVRIENADELVANARRVLKNSHENNPCAVAAAIALTTGRRMVEVLQKGTFEVESKYRILFQGQAKAGLQEISGITTDKPLSYSIPTLAPAANIVNALSALREHGNTANMDAKQVNSKWCGKLNKFVKQHIHQDLTFHDLRTAYALISYEAWKPHTYSINGWICNVLGHFSLGMSVSYTRLQVYGLNKLRRCNREASEDFTLQEEGEDRPR